MGMFDEIICDYPLPKLPKFVGPGYLFQTKDLDCLMNQYSIDSNGQFSDPNFTGTINFYTSNISGSGPGLYTKNGEDAESVDYSAKIVDGNVVEVKQTHYSIKPALKTEYLFKHCDLTEEEKAKETKKFNENLAGQSVYVLHGGQKTGYWSKVVYSGKKEHCIESDDHGLEKLHRFQRNIIFFDTEEEAFSYRDSRNKSWQERKEIYEIYAAQRQLEIDNESIK